jgi:hypothetical protein
VTQGKLGHKDPKVLREEPDHKVLKDRPGQRDHKVLKDRPGQRELPALLVLKEFKGLQEEAPHRVKLGLRVQLELPAPLALKVPKVQRDRQGRQVRKVRKVQRDLLE